MTIRQFFRTIWAGRYYVLVAVVVVVLAALAYLDRQDTEYRATAVVQLVPTQSVQGGDQPVEVTVATDVDDVTSTAVLDAAAAMLGDGTTPADLRQQVSAEYGSEDGRIILVHGETLSPQESQDVANAVAEAYVAQVAVIQADQMSQLDAQRQALREQLATVDAQLAANPDDPLAAAERTTIVNQYQALTLQINTLRSIVTPAEIVTPATSAGPVGLSSLTVVAIALLAGLLAGIGLAFARRGLDVRIRTTTEAGQVAETPVLAELYGTRAAHHDFRATRTLPVSSKVATPFTESIRELRTAVEVSLSQSQHAIVVVTAADPLAPRSFIAANLAASFALSGRRTVAVSGDLRRPQLDSLLPVPTTAHGGGAGDAARATAVSNLEVFTLPDEGMDPADYLATDRARGLLEGLRRRAEVVVVDAPPVLAAADATILGRYATGVVLVAAAGKTDRAVLSEAADRLRVNNVPLLGVAIAGVKSDRRMLYASTYGAETEPTRTGILGRARAGGRASSGGGAASGADRQPEPVAPATEHVSASTASRHRAGAARTAEEQRPDTPEEPGPAEAAEDVPTEDALAAGDETGTVTPAALVRAAASESGSGRGSAGAPLLAPSWAKVPSSDVPAELPTQAEPERRRPFRW